MKQKIILASTSPRRKGLLQQIGIEFKVMPSNYIENMKLKMPPHRLAMEMARGKALDVAGRIREGIVIGADTFVTVDGKVLGKPKSRQEAIRMMMAQSGKIQKIYSGVAIIDAKTKKEIVDYEITKIWVRKMSHEEVVRYVDSEKPMDKAGAMCMQGLGAIFIEKIDGCYFNVVGLPLHKIFQLLKRFKVSIFAYERWKNSAE